MGNRTARVRLVLSIPEKGVVASTIISEDRDWKGAQSSGEGRANDRPPDHGCATMANLTSSLNEAFKADPADCLICPMGDSGYATLFGVVPAVLAVMRTAAEIEPCPEEVMTWYTRVRIRELGDLTAESLVAMGRTEAVVDFLRAIRDGKRG